MKPEMVAAAEARTQLLVGDAALFDVGQLGGLPLNGIFDDEALPAEVVKAELIPVGPVVFAGADEAELCL
ncbi:MAG: hypothetical protein COW34_04995, partial [Armatimonadetes bacterium CG17_big_fil_post_rev_8_21_14_2_50_66_6]